MRVGITGHSGFIGSHVAKALTENGIEILNLDPWTRKSKGHADLPKDRLDWVLHFAAKTNISESQKNPSEFYRANLDSTLEALSIASKYKSHFLLMSSYVYGHPEYQPIDESHPTKALNPYMGSKLACEELARVFCEEQKMTLVVFRAFNIYGQQNHPGRLITDLFDCLRHKKALEVKDPIPKRDYLHIDDFCELITKLLRADHVKGTFNVGFGKTFSNLEVAQLVKKESASPHEIIVHHKSRPSDVMECLPSLEKLKRATGWEPSIHLEHGIKQVLGAGHLKKTL